MVSAQMSRMPRSATTRELILRKGLHAQGLRYTVNRRDLPGTPDIVFSRAKLAVFVDGCFWHGCPEHGVLPKHNRHWWKAKLERNVERDREKDEELKEMGWLPMHFWEHEDLDNAVKNIVEQWALRTGGARSARRL
jgi:DNA mismatch endonuclease (patch repair protein)